MHKSIAYAKISAGLKKRPVVSCILRKGLLLIIFLAVTTVFGWAQTHDLVMQSAPDITSSIISNCQSPDIRLGAAFGAGTASTTILHGRTNKLYARFRVNGILDPLIPASSPVRIHFYYHQAAFIGENPPPAGDSSWNYINTLYADGMFTPDIYLGLGTSWPDNYPAASNLSVNWTAPASGNYFHILAVTELPPGYTDDLPGNNTAISLYEAITQPHDIEVVLVHDVSGSMLSTTYNGSTYIEHARQAAEAFVGYMNTNDKLAIVAYGGCLPGGVSTIWPASDLAPMNLVNKQIAINEITSKITVPNTSCLTPMGDGIQRAIDILTNSGSSDPDVKKIILLLTDGYENSGTLRACSYSSSPPCISSPVLATLQAKNIHVYSVALGPVGWNDCIECLAVNSDGQWSNAGSPGVELQEAYLDMQQAYEDDDLYKKDITTVGAGSDSYQAFFEGMDDTLYFILGWDNLDTKMDLVLTSPSGKRPDVYTFRDRGFVVHQVNKPEKGMWKYTVEGPAGERYLAAVRSARVGVRMSLNLKSKRIVGSDISINAGISGISPKAADIKAVISFPAKQSVDTQLSTLVRNYILNYKKLPVTPEDIKRNPDQNPKGIFLSQIFKDRINPAEIFPVSTVDIPLKLNADGVFTGTFSGSSHAAGQYTVTVKSSGKEFDRVYSGTTLLKPDKAAIERSYADLLALDTLVSKISRQFVVKIYCNDRYGNLTTAQDLLKRLTFKYVNCEPAGKPEAAFDNTCQQLVNVPLDQKFDVIVMLDGKQLPVNRY